MNNSRLIIIGLSVELRMTAAGRDELTLRKALSDLWRWYWDSGSIRRN